MSIRDGWTAQEALVAFDEHLRRVRGVCAGTRRNYARFAGAFLQAVFPDGLVVVERVGVNDVIDFVAAAARRYRPATVELAATSLRSLLRFWRVTGLRTDRLEDAVSDGAAPHAAVLSGTWIRIPLSG